MKSSSREALAAYYREAGSWAHDQVASLQKSRKIAWRVAAAAAAVALVEGIALVVLMPLKTVEPYTLMVDRTTGYVQQLSPLDPARITPDQALVQSMLAQYVIARESFDVATLQTNYRKVGLWSAGAARASYIEGMRASNPQSPLAALPRTAVVETRVKSVSPLTPDTALVRFETLRTGGERAYVTPSPWAAVVRYRFSSEPASAEDRFQNPLGFQVTEYRKDAEAAANAAWPDTVSVPMDATPVDGDVVP